MYVTNLPCQTFVTMIPILGFHMYWEGQREVAGDGFRITKILQWQDLPLQLKKCNKQIHRETEKETHREFNYRGHSNLDGSPG